MDNIFPIQHIEHIDNFLQHINSADQVIRFKVEDIWPDGSMPFLDTFITPEPNRTLSIGMYRKPTSIDQYLQWDSHHQIAVKNTVVNTLTHRAKVVCTTLELPHLPKQNENKNHIQNIPKITNNIDLPSKTRGHSYTIHTRTM